MTGSGPWRCSAGSGARVATAGASGDGTGAVLRATGVGSGGCSCSAQAVSSRMTPSIHDRRIARLWLTRQLLIQIILLMPTHGQLRWLRRPWLTDSRENIYSLSTLVEIKTVRSHPACSVRPR